MDKTWRDDLTLWWWRRRLGKLRHLYHYAPLNTDERFRWFEDMLLRSTFYFRSRSQLNDPFDGRMRLNPAAPKAVKRRFWEDHLKEQGRVIDDTARAEVGRILTLSPEEHQKRLWKSHDEQMDTLGFGCFSERPDDMAMWSYYADGHRGVCLRFTTVELLKWQNDFPPMRMSYPSRYPDVSFYRHSVFRRMRASIVTKAAVWKHEREWRVMHMTARALYRFAPASLNGVIMGCQIGEQRAQVMSTLGQRPGVQPLEAHMADRRFRIEIRPA